MIKTLLFIALTFTTISTFAGSSSVALVTQVSGSSSPSQDKGKLLEVLNELQVDDEISVPLNSSMIAVFYENTEHYEIIGPAKFKVSSNKLVPLEGNEPKFKGKALSGKKPIKLNPLKVTQAAVPMRSAKVPNKIEILSMNETTVLLEDNEFNWEPIQDNVNYKFQLVNSSGEEIYQTETANTQLKLPLTVNLISGEDYRWRISTKNSNKQLVSNVGRFKVANNDQLADANEILNQSNNEFTTDIIIASWLAQNGFMDLARTIYKKYNKETLM